MGLVASVTRRVGFGVVLVALVAGCLSRDAAADFDAPYLFTLSSFAGPIPFDWVSVTANELTGEVYVADGGQRSVVVFNEQGMEVYRFGDDDRLGNIADVVVFEDGDLLLLSYRPREGAPAEWRLVRCDYRGEPKGELAWTGVPPEFADLQPARLLVRDRRLYLADLNAMRVVEVDESGRFHEGYDLGALLGMTAEQVVDSGLGGVDVDAEGDLLFTVPAAAQAYRMTPDRKVSGFGKRGSGPGKFGVPKGIGADAEGTLYVVDALRCVVLAFDREFRFQGEFGFRGLRPGGLIAPSAVAVSPKGRVYVTQNARRGVSVFQVARH